MEVVRRAGSGSHAVGTRQVSPVAVSVRAEIPPFVRHEGKAPAADAGPSVPRSGMPDGFTAGAGICARCRRLDNSHWLRCPSCGIWAVSSCGASHRLSTTPTPASSVGACRFGRQVLQLPPVWARRSGLHQSRQVPSLPQRRPSGAWL
jgi:hypothetical protein